MELLAREGAIEESVLREAALKRSKTRAAKFAISHRSLLHPSCTRPLPRASRRFLLPRHHRHIRRRFRAAHLHHPGIQQALLEAPAIAQFERRNEPL